MTSCGLEEFDECFQLHGCVQISLNSQSAAAVGHKWSQAALKHGQEILLAHAQRNIRLSRRDARTTRSSTSTQTQSNAETAFRGFHSSAQNYLQMGKPTKILICLHSFSWHAIIYDQQGMRDYGLCQSLFLCRVGTFFSLQIKAL